MLGVGGRRVKEVSKSNSFFIFFCLKIFFFYFQIFSQPIVTYAISMWRCKIIPFKKIVSNIWWQLTNQSTSTGNLPHTADGEKSKIEKISFSNVWEVWPGLSDKIEKYKVLHAGFLGLNFEWIFEFWDFLRWRNKWIQYVMCNLI